MLLKFILTMLISIFAIHARASGSNTCEQHITAIVCLVDPPTHEPDRYKDGRPCLKSSAAYTEAIVNAYRTYPPFVQALVCDLKRIYIEKSFFGPAWSALDSDPDPHSGLVGLNHAEIDAGLPVERDLSWFEQQSFGSTANFQFRGEFPKVRIEPSEARKFSGTVYSLLHEMGHIFDYRNKFNDEKCGQDCRPDLKSWTAISWKSIQVPKAASDFDLRKRICLNNCGGHFLQASDSSTLYREIYQHGFISQLSAVNAMEDFAESFAVYVASRDMGMHIRVDANSDTDFKLDDVMASAPFKQKLDFLKAHLPEQ